MPLPAEGCGAIPRWPHATLPDVLSWRAVENSQELAYRFLPDGGSEERCLSYGELARQARAVATALLQRDLANQPVLLAHPANLDFLTGLFGCWYAGAIAVPAHPPRGSKAKRRIQSIVSNSGANFALGADDDLPALESLGLAAAATASLAITCEVPPDLPGLSAPGPCLIQYTSGSTAEPKGVMITHANLVANLAALHPNHLPNPVTGAVSWLPPQHDMGLVLNFLHALHGGFPLTFLPPESFIQRPLRWLQAISRHQAELSGGPNFAFDLCVRAVRGEKLQGLDLSRWKIAPCGAERVREETLRRFAETFAPCGFDPAAFRPAYGLAEATLTVAASVPGSGIKTSRHPTAGPHVSCGTVLEGHALRIVDPLTNRPCADLEIGEIHVAGPSVAGGYWRNPAATAETFDHAGGGWLRTGDLGYLDCGELHVTSRIKDLIVIDGTNHAPDDIEAAATGAHLDIADAAAAAVAVDLDGREQALLLLEVMKPADPAGWQGITTAVRAAVGEQTGLPLRQVVLVRRGSLPRTTSGKIRRAAAREQWVAGQCKVIHQDLPEPVAVNLSPAGRKILAALLQLAADLTPHHVANPDDDVIRLGMSSLDVTRLAAGLRARLGLGASLGELFAARSFAALAQQLATRHPSFEPPVDSNGPRLLSHSQERMWFLHQLSPSSAAYHVFGALEFQGTLNPAAFSRAFDSLVSRHPALRTRYGSDTGRPVVWTDDRNLATLRTESCAPERVEERLRRFASEPFDLAGEPLARALLLDCGGPRHVFAVCAHHIVVDGWSMRVLANELAALYRHETGAGGPLPPPPVPGYLEYASWHRRWIDGGAVDAQVEAWKHRLAGHEGIMPLPLDFPRPAKGSSDGGAVRRRIPPEVLASVRDLAKSHRTTPFTVFLAAFLVLLRRHAGHDDPVVAVPVANRNRQETADLVGTLVNTLPFRLPLDASEPFASLLDRVHAAALAMQESQDAPFEKIIDAVKPERARDHAPLAQVMIDHQELPLAEQWTGELNCQPLLIHRGATQFDLSLLLFALPGHHQAVIEYRRDLFREATADALLARFLHLLAQVTRSHDTPIGRFHTLTDEDQAWLRKVGAGEPHPVAPARMTPALVAAAAAKTPAKTAVVAGDAKLSHGELDLISSRLSAGLRRSGVRPGDRVAVMFDRDHLLPAALLAVWKAGAAYVPLDPANPRERLRMILEDQAPGHIWVAENLQDRLPPGHPFLPFRMPATKEDGELADLQIPGPADTAYIIYTSGSTGRPKGVVVSHGALSNFLLSMAREPGMAQSDHLLAVTTVSFDISLLEIFLPLVTGATVEIVPHQVAKDGARLRSLLENSPATVMQATPATWRMLVDAGWQGSSRLRVLCGGEALDPPLARQLATRCAELWNLYGPTETTVWSTAWKVPPDTSRVSIGKPIANTTVRIQAPEGTLVPPGVTGELCIGGSGVANGYWRRDDLTKERFVDIDGHRHYRTGDLARWLPDGTLECLGRSDGQVKIRGFRVELGEIEAAIAAHPAVAEAAVVVRGSGGNESLAGFYRSPDESLTPATLACFLHQLLPDYMLPSSLRRLNQLPLTSSGKIDRRALASMTPPDEPPANNPRPRDAITGELTALWGELLDRKDVGVDEDFFDAGGHSLLATRLVAEASRRIGVPVSLDWLFETPTIAGMAEQIRRHASLDLAQPRVIPLETSAGGRPLFWVHTLVDGGMGLFPYRDAAKLLGCVACSHGLAEGTRTFDSIREMADCHVQKLRQVQPHGPYRLAGYCFGGNLAAEIAWQLVAEGEEIELLALLEAQPPGNHALRQAANTWSLANVLPRIPRRLGGFLNLDLPTALRRLRIKQRAFAGHLATLLRPNSPRIPDIGSVLDIEVLDSATRQRATAHWRALHQHVPRVPAVKRLAVVRAEDDGWRPRPPALGWEWLAPVAPEVHRVPGCHETFLRGDSAQHVAAALRVLLHNADP